MIRSFAFFVVPVALRVAGLKGAEYDARSSFRDSMHTDSKTGIEPGLTTMVCH